MPQTNPRTSCVGCQFHLTPRNAELCNSPNLKNPPDVIFYAVSLCGKERQWYQRDPIFDSHKKNSNEEPISTIAPLSVSGYIRTIS